MRPPRPEDTAFVLIDEWHVAAYASPMLAATEVARLRRRVGRALTRMARRTSRRSSGSRSIRIEVEPDQ